MTRTLTPAEYRILRLRAAPLEIKPICGWVGRCGRNAHHPGHHGGFRPLEDS